MDSHAIAKTEPDLIPDMVLTDARGPIGNLIAVSSEQFDIGLVSHREINAYSITRPDHHATLSIEA